MSVITNRKSSGQTIQLLMLLYHVTYYCTTWPIAPVANIAGKNTRKYVSGRFCRLCVETKVFFRHYVLCYVLLCVNRIRCSSKIQNYDKFSGEQEFLQNVQLILTLTGLLIAGSYLVHPVSDSSLPRVQYVVPVNCVHEAELWVVVDDHVSTDNLSQRVEAGNFNENLTSFKSYRLPSLS